MSAEWGAQDWDALADWLGEQEGAFNVTDPSDEQTTWLTGSVDDLARALLASGVVVPARVVEEARALSRDFWGRVEQALAAQAAAEAETARLREQMVRVKAALMQGGQTDRIRWKAAVAALAEPVGEPGAGEES